MSRVFSPARTAMLGLLFMTLVACVSSAPTRFYMLNSVVVPEKGGGTGENGPPPAIEVGPVEFPAYLDRKQIVTRISENELRLAEFHEWAEPLKDNFVRVLAANLSVILSTDALIVFPYKGPTPADYKVEVEVTRFDGRTGGDVTLAALWTIYGEDGKKVLLIRKSRFKEAIRGLDYETIVAAQSLTVAALSRQIAEAIRSLSRGRPRP